MALLTCCGADHAPNHVRAVAALGLPTQADGREYRYSFLQTQPFPSCFSAGDQDEFATAAQLEQLAASGCRSQTAGAHSGADHFFTGQLEPMQHALAGWLKEYLL